MSKSNADFSAFDFNDSSDNSDTPARNPFISRNVAQNNNTNSNSKTSTQNLINNNNNNSSNNNNNNNSHSNNSLSSNASNSNHSASNVNRNDSHCEQEREQQRRQQQQQQSKRPTQINGNILEATEHDDNESDNDNFNDNDDEHEHEQPAVHYNHANVDDEDDDDDDEDDDDDDDDEANTFKGNTAKEATNASSANTTATTNANVNSNNLNNNQHSNNINDITNPTAATTTTTTNNSNNNSSNNNNHTTLTNASKSTSKTITSATALETNSNCAVSNLLENGGNSNNCNDLARSRSHSFSNNSTATTNNISGNANGSSLCSFNIGNSVAGLGMGNGTGGSGGGLAGASAGSGSIIGLGGSGGSGGPGSICLSDRRKFRHQNYSKNIYIGTKNAEKWELMRSNLRFKNDVEFVAYLLNLADNDTDRLNNLPPLSDSNTPTKGFDGNFKLEPNLSVKEFAANENSDSQPMRRKSKKHVQFNDASNNSFPKMKNFTNFPVKSARGRKPKHMNINNNGDMVPEVLDCRIAEKIKSELEEKTASKESIPNALCLKKGDVGYVQRSDNDNDNNDNDLDNDDDYEDAEDGEDVENAAASTSGSNANAIDGVDGINRLNGNFRMRIKNKQTKPVKAMMPPNAFTQQSVEDDDDEGDYTDGGDDDDDQEMDEEALALEMKREQNFVEEEDEHDIAFRSQQSCRECSITHDFKVCPLRTAIGTVTDAVDLTEWIERRNLEALSKLKHDVHRQTKQAHVDDDDEDMDDTSQMSELETKPLITFAEASVPAEFELHNVEPHVNGVFARTDMRAYTKLGPLIGQAVENSEVREGSDMKWIFEICEPGAEKSRLLCCDNPNTSNWLRYIRPAPTFEERNVTLVSIEQQAYFVTCCDIKNGIELLYWSDECNTMWRKKHNEKTTCGGCNLKFDHSLYYRTHCSIFHDPSMSLTIRKYHCKVCGEAVLGKDNIMKHAAEKHDGKGAHQCQFCLKYFLRLNYLEMHRTYGCAANPNRARPLCDFCGRKFCQPQKLKAHIKRMHSDMAEVLRDFQCKLCSKLLGSRAALQRHSKEVHSRNSTVVSCPRCQKLFQNRSNLKIHMLTHSGVRPFKCAEPECNAAFTTKQCLQFHYKKVHNYTQEQMPKIERSVAYTFDAYSGGMKVDFLEQAPRRRRKSLEDQNSMLSSSMQSDTEFSDDNIFEAIKKSGKSIKDLCRNEPNLSLLSSKISSMFGEKVVARKRRKRKDTSSSMLQDEDDDEERLEHVRRKQNAQLSLVESFLTTTAQRLTAQQQVQQVVAAAAAVSAMAGGTADEASKMHMMSGLNAQHMGMGHAAVMPNDEDDDDEDDDDLAVHASAHHANMQQTQHDNNSYHRHAGMNTLGQNLVVSKGSKKWISGDERHLQRDCASVDRCAMGNAEMVGTGLNGSQPACGLAGAGVPAEMGLPGFAVPPSGVDDHNKLLGQNRDFLSRLMSSASANHSHHQTNQREEDENSSYLDVVESNNNAAAAAAAAAQISQYHHNANGQTNNGNDGNGNGNNGGSLNNAPNNVAQQADDTEMQMNSLAHSQSFMNSFYNNANARLTSGGASASSSASMLVEAALNSVGNMIDNESNDLKVPTDNNINTDSPMSSHVDSESNRFTNSNTNHAINSMDNLENELKMMKNLSNFPMQIPPLPMFQNNANTMNNCNISPSASTPTNPQSNQNNNDVDVDAGSTPRAHHMSGSAGDSDGFSSAHHRTPPSPPPISPGRDYGMFASSGNVSGGGTPGGPGTAGSSSSGHSAGTTGNNISASSPLPTMQAHRRNASSVGSTYPEHELVSPASSPSIPRYNFNGDMLRHKRAEQEHDRRQNLSRHNHLSSDEENSMMPQNSSGQDMRMKFSQPQMDLMYSKYESMSSANAGSLKYNSHELDSPAEYRSNNNANVSVSGPSGGADISDLQGLDMSSRSNLGSSNYHHNFQLPGSASSNLPGIGRYHHHIYDILSEREQSQQAQQQQHHSSVAAAAAAAAAAQHQQQEHSSQLAMQQHSSVAMHNMLNDQLSEQEHDQATSVDLSRTANYVVSSPPQLPYNHPHHDMLRMASLDLTPNTNMPVGNNRSFLSSQMQHQSRDSLDHHRLLSTVEQHRILAASNAADQHRLLVDPTAHLLMEQNQRLLGTDQTRLLGETAQNRHMARSFGAYHQVASGNYHPGVRPPVLPSANHHASNPSNYHPFPAYY